MSDRSKVTVDFRPMERLVKRLISASKVTVQAGHFDSHQHPAAKMTIAALGLLQHEGGQAGRGVVIPARPYIAEAVNMPITLTMMADTATEIVEGTAGISTRSKKLGRALRDQIDYVIENPNEFGIKKNAEYTVKLKGIDAPLQDTLHLKDDLDFRIVTKK